jgi:hypothetical protein
MKRREFIAALCGAAWPSLGRAQQSAMPVIGLLDSSSADEYAPFLTAFALGLNEVGFVEGRNVAIKYRWADGRYDRLPALATELVRAPVTVLVATGTHGHRSAGLRIRSPKDENPPAVVALTGLRD